MAHPSPGAAPATPDGEQAETRERIVWVAMDEIAVGMFAHPLSSASFLIARKDQIRTLRETGAKGVFVDLAKSSPASLPEWARAMAGIKRETGAGAGAATPRVNRRAAAFDRARQVLTRSRAPMERLLRQARLGKTLEKKEVIDLVEEIAASVEQCASAIISLSRIKTVDTFTYLHSLAVCALMVNFARNAGFSRADVQELGMAGLLHDVGKTVVGSAILNKPGPLTPAEMTTMRTHAQAGHDILSRGGQFPATVLDVALHHHEKIDGTGYPHKLAGDAISVPARMAAIADVYDAVTSNRPYKEAWLPGESLADMFSWQGHFDTELMQTFIRSVGIYPVGSLVRLASERLALVIEQDEADLTRPLVRIFYSIPQREPVTITDLALAREQGDSILSREDPRKWGFLDWDRRWPEMIRLD
ncbi:HD-GYP domain-containing protein [Sphingosinicella sp. YJ22]|uniref:HD-GYP domain-containing protein n=1 Tax=Sphingosinicella sp. YJ22 TaxID=1104780 RepID=UPI001FAFAC5D|nr:HD-GYP domain-containing protein [Sphingosinicella sp. YJ22]